LQPDVAAWKCDEQAVKADGTCPLVESAPAREALVIKNANSDSEGQSLQFEAEVRPKALPGPGNYCYRIIFRPSTYSLSSWVTEWDLTLSQINATRTNQQQFDGSRTYNLKSFLDTLWGATQEKH